MGQWMVKPFQDSLVSIIGLLSRMLGNTGFASHNNHGNKDTSTNSYSEAVSNEAVSTSPESPPQKSCEFRKQRSSFRTRRLLNSNLMHRMPKRKFNASGDNQSRSVSDKVAEIVHVQEFFIGLYEKKIITSRDSDLWKISMMKSVWRNMNEGFELRFKAAFKLEPKLRRHVQNIKYETDSHALPKKKTL